MRFVLFLLTALCLSALSFSAAANVRSAVPKVVAAKAEAAKVEVAIPDYDARLATGDDLAQLALPGDPDFGDEAEFDDGPPPGYCNIWSADLLDPLDLFDAVDETSALFIFPHSSLRNPSMSCCPRSRNAASSSPKASSGRPDPSSDRSGRRPC